MNRSIVFVFERTDQTWNLNVLLSETHSRFPLHCSYRCIGLALYSLMFSVMVSEGQQKHAIVCSHRDQPEAHAAESKCWRLQRALVVAQKFPKLSTMHSLDSMKGLVGIWYCVACLQ